MKVTIQFYGAFRQFGQDLSFTLSSPITVRELKSLLVSSLGAHQKDLIESSAFASESSIIGRDSLIETDCTLSILPPVCGG